MGGSLEHTKKIIDSEIFLEVFKTVPSLSNKGRRVMLEGFREMLNNVMDMTDTPKKVVKLIDFYATQVEKIIVKSNDNFIDEIIDDVNDLLDDLEPYI